MAFRITFALLALVALFGLGAEARLNKDARAKTDKGRELSTALIALMQWGDRWCGDGPPPVVLRHTGCDTPIELDVRCPECRRPITPTEISSTAGGRP